MRAEWNTTCDVFDGPGTATPGFPRILGLACRLVPDPYFRDTTIPLLASTAYLTHGGNVINGPTITDNGGGKYEFDFAKADRIVVASVPTVTWVTVRVESCTWPRNVAPYWRASLAPDEPPEPTACQASYLTTYYLHDYSTGTTYTVTRTGPTTWEGDGLTVEAETDGPPNEFCESLWTATGPDTAISFGYYGLGTLYRYNTLPPHQELAFGDTV